ncbi:MAG: ATP-dependent RecD-like DNA helicase [Lachnospiraceae bacterium]|nr:ATP-dependent RecD-like DNA helicase [Candidatus Colinaster equi]
MESYQGYIDHFLFKNDTNGYGVLELDTEDDDIICVGTFTGISQGETIEVEGEWVEHPTYGPQLKVSSCKVIEPTGILDMERYLASGAIKGVGPSIAKKIIKKFGKDTFRIIEEEPERLVEIKGISERIAIQIATQMEERRELRDTVMFLQKYGISNNMAIKLFEVYGITIKSILLENPYKLAEDVDGIGFRKADEIATHVGIKIDSQYRLQCGLIYVLNQAAAEGHVYLPKNILLDRANELMGVGQSLIENEIPELIMNKKIIMKNESGTDNCYTAMMYYEELGCARMLSQLNLRLDNRDSNTIDDEVNEAMAALDIELDELQREAVIGAIKSGVFILTGGPGTGKTTTINAIINYFVSKKKDIMLAAPTGRAAKRMTEATGYEAKTIHRLLEVSGNVEGGGVRFDRNEDNPLECDVVIIDEASMVDIHLFYSLLKAMVAGMHLIIVGDDNQLPSVGPGQVLHDLIMSAKFQNVCLTKIFRQATHSDIVVNAHKINKGEEIQLDNKSEDFFFLERNDTNVIYKHMVLLITQKLPKYVNSDPFQIQVLTPTRIGNLGVEALNKVLQQYLNPPAKNKKEHMMGETLFREGDKVMQIKNNYNLEWEIMSSYNIAADSGTGVFNGDMGVIKEINTALQSVKVEFDDGRTVRYSFSGLDELELSYAVTIHKSQGSEYPAVVIPLLGGPRQLLNRNLLYTGVTRAKKCVTILGSKDTLNTMIHNESEKIRYTGLTSRIREVEEGECV